MNIEELHSYCLTLKGAEETFPFDDTTLVMKVGGKMFALIPLDTVETSISLKCDPEKALQLRDEFPSVRPGYHLSKKHWNTVYMDGSISEELLKQWIVDSYELVVAGLPKKIREELSL
jgi:predicted DNA-binding protein (MmcQ/YjbR family)